MIKKAILAMLIVALVLSSAGCTKTGTTEPGTQAVTATPSPTGQATATPQATVSPGTTTATDNPYGEWSYIDPSVVAVSGEEDG